MGAVPSQAPQGLGACPALGAEPGSKNSPGLTAETSTRGGTGSRRSAPSDRGPAGTRSSWHPPPGRLFSANHPAHIRCQDFPSVNRKSTVTANPDSLGLWSLTCPGTSKPLETPTDPQDVFLKQEFLSAPSPWIPCNTKPDTLK